MNHSVSKRLVYTFVSVITVITYMRVVTPYLVTYPHSFTPMVSLALLSGYFYKRQLIGIFLTLSALWVSDLVLDSVQAGHLVLFYKGFLWQYTSFALLTCLGFLMTLRNLYAPMMMSFVACFLFYVISNFGVWMSATVYPLTLQGLLTCYVAGIPFAVHMTVSTVVFTAMSFYSLKAMALAPDTTAQGARQLPLLD